MNQATNVNIVPSYGQRGDLHFSQYDVGRTATINLYAVNEAYTIPVGATVKIQATKPSGLGFDVACTFSGSVVTVVSTETMTEEAGRFPCELRITKDSDVIGTANFMFVVEASPHPDGTVDGDSEAIVNEIEALVLQSEGYALGTQNGVPVTIGSPYYHHNAKWLSENAVLTDEVKQALLNCFEKVAWIDGNGQTYYDALATALNRGAELLSISAVYTQSGTVYDTDSLDSLKADLVVTATYDDSSTETVLTYTLSGSLTVGTSTITVSYGGKTTTFNVTVTAYWDVEWSYTDGLPENNGFTKANDVSNTVSLGTDGLLCTATGSGVILSWTPNGETSCTKTIFECVFVPKTLLSKSTLTGDGIKAITFNGTYAITLGINSQGLCYYGYTPSTAYYLGASVTANTTYKLRVETGQTEGAIYLNDTLVTTYSSFGATTSTVSKLFACTGGNNQSVLLKSIKYRFES